MNKQEILDLIRDKETDFEELRKEIRDLYRDLENL